MLKTDEIKKTVATEMDSLLATYGLWGIILLALVGAALYFLSRIYVNKLVEREIRTYQSELDKNSIKSIEIWKMKKDITFELIDFLEGNMFYNPILNSSASEAEKAAEMKRITTKFNILYGKLYTLLDTNIVKNINKIIDGATSEISRYYIYREIRIELQSYISGEKTTYDSCPHINRDVDKILTPEGTPNATSIDELRQTYSFIEKGDSSTQAKGLPHYGSP
jgi:hypothetical protein